MGAVFTACVADPVVKGALVASPPEPNGRLNAATCESCAAGQFTNDHGVCTACAGTVVGNSCLACTVDVTIDGNTFNGATFDPTVPITGDTCSDVFWVRLNNPQALFARGATALDITAGPPSLFTSGFTPAQCQQSWEVTFGHMGTSVPIVDSLVRGTGLFVPCSPAGLICINSCTELPTRHLVGPNVAAGAPVVFAVPATTAAKLLYVNPTFPPPIVQ